MALEASTKPILELVLIIPLLVHIKAKAKQATAGIWSLILEDVMEDTATYVH